MSVSKVSINPFGVASMDASIVSRGLRMSTLGFSAGLDFESADRGEARRARLLEADCRRPNGSRSS